MNRLEIAAMAMQGVFSNTIAMEAVRATLKEMQARGITITLQQVTALVSLEYADALLEAEAKSRKVEGCMFCSGSGQMPVHGNEKIKCPYCNGTGKEK